jgi:DHA1 family bicyclomycin/chloramphenicol resistance-like MFS transporter
MGKASSSPALTPIDHPKTLVLTLAAMSSIGPFSVDTYLPSFHHMAEDFAVPIADVQLSLSVYLSAFAFMTLWHGSLSDTYGRKRVVMWGITVFALGSLIAMLAQNLGTVLLGRVIQGLSAGSGVVVARAIVRDCFEGDEAQRIMSSIGMIFPLAPAIAPMIGGLLQVWFGWRAVFAFLFLFALGLGWLCWRYLPETLAPDRRNSFHPRSLWRSYHEIFLNPVFQRASVAVALGFSGFFVYIISSPILLIQHWGLSETQFYILFIPSTFGMLIGAWASGKVAGRWTRHQTLTFAGLLMIIACGINITMAWWQPHTLPWAMIGIPFYTIGMSMAMPVLSLIVLDIFGTKRGMAASCQSFVHLIFGALLAGFLAPQIWNSALGLPIWSLVASVIAFALAQRIFRKPRP